MAEPLSIARGLQDRYGVADVAVTRGAEPVLAVAGDRVTELQVPAVAVVDTLAAGDVFHGAYLVGRYLREIEHHGALAFAAQVASASCRYAGPRAGVRAVSDDLGRP